MSKPKANDEPVTLELLASRCYTNYPKAKWIVFCEAMLGIGFDLTLYEARETVSKYITVWKDGRSFKVRYSNHMPNLERLNRGDCDFFVGKTQRFTTNSRQAIEAVKRFFGLEPDPSIKMPAEYADHRLLFESEG